jgi:hypothetical protein
MIFALFYQADLSGKLAPLLGSDCYCPIDGRFGIDRACDVACDQIQTLSRVKPCIIGYEIRRGSIAHNSPISVIHAAPDRMSEFKAAKEKGIVKWG